MCKEDDIENLQYILEEAPDYKVDLKHSRYSHLDTIIRQNSHQVLMFFVERNLVILDSEFQKHFESKNYPKNIATSIIETCIFNEKLEKKLENRYRDPIRHKI